MTDRRDPAETAELLARLVVAEQEIERLRRFRVHDYQSDKMVLVLLADKVERIKQDLGDGTKRLSDLSKAVDGVLAKIGEYDKEHTVVGRILWPIVVLCVGGFVLWLGRVLLKLYGILGP